MRAFVVACGALLVAHVGCALERPGAYSSAMRHGDQAARRADDTGAVAAYDRAAASTPRAADQDEARYRAAQAARHAGRLDEALVRFDALARAGASGERAARAALEAIRIRQGRGEYDRAERDALALAVRSPGTGPARRALALAWIARDARDPSGESALGWISMALTQLGSTELGSALRLERARRLAALGRETEAIEAYEALLAEPYPRNLHWDDGGLAYARFRLEHGASREALRIIERVLSVRESTLIPLGSYERPRFGELQLLRARVLRDGLRDPRAAADAFRALHEQFPQSRLRDDAMEEEAALRASLGERERACALWIEIARTEPCTARGARGVVAARSCGAALQECRAPGRR